MANYLSIPSIRERLFNTSKHERTTQRNSSNPFAATTFKGNVLTADVFESSAKKNTNEFTPVGKLKASALVGSISGIGEGFQNIIRSVVSFGNRIKESTVNGWNKLNGIEISFAPAMEGMTSAYETFKRVMNTPVENHISPAYNSFKEVMSTPISEFMTSGISAKSVSKMEDMTEARKLLSDNVAMWEAAS